MRSNFGVLIFAVGLMVTAAGGAVFPQFQGGSYGSTKANSIEQTAAAPMSNDGNFAVASYPSFPPELAAGEARAEPQASAPCATAPAISPCSRLCPRQPGRRK